MPVPRQSDLDLASLVSPMRRETFLGEYWPTRSTVQHGDPARLAPLASCPELADVGSAVKLGGPKIRCWFDDADGEIHQIRVSPDDALCLFEAKVITTLGADGIHERLPPAARLMANLVRDLGIPMEYVQCTAYASPEGRGTGMHFDEQEVFFLQLRGRKRWRFAPNREVAFPTASHFGAKKPAFELSLVTSTFPTRMPDDCRTVTLSPGSVLFLPRGTWHESVALEESLALTLTFKSQNWIDLLWRELRPRLLKSASWRRPVPQLLAPAAESAAARQAAEMLQALASEVGSLRAEDLIHRARIKHVAREIACRGSGRR